MNLNFVAESTLNGLENLDQSKADQLDHGVVKVDKDGTIQIFNDYESKLSGCDKNAVLGKNFFTEVAPCTNNRLFYGKFKSGVEAGELELKIPYTFTYKMRPANVFVHMKIDKATGTNWVFIKYR